MGYVTKDYAEKKRKLEVYLEIMKAVVATIKEAGKLGAPSGPMYAALMTTGMTLEQYETMMQTLVNSGVIRKSGHCYFFVEIEHES